MSHGGRSPRRTAMLGAVTALVTGLSLLAPSGYAGAARPSGYAGAAPAAIAGTSTGGTPTGGTSTAGGASTGPVSRGGRNPAGTTTR
ncbi:MAG TPA: hypothetical protein VES95_04655 [Dermatophilaceae bacterium]|nr:hypothetical protein [Dermatophilaceae bacterium]